MSTRTQTFASEAEVASLTTLVASGCAPCQEEQARAAAVERAAADRDAATVAAEDAARAADRDALATSTADAEVAPEDAPPPSQNWEGVIGMEGTMTGDGRFIEPDALRWEGLPLPLRHVVSDVGAHDGAVVVGSIDEITRNGNEVRASGRFDLDSDAGREAARLVASGMTTGVSMDLDDVSFEVRIASEVAAEMDAMLDALMTGEEPPEPEENEDGTITVATVKPDDEVRVTTDGRVRAATLVAIPAFAEAKITSTPADEPEEDPGEVDDGVLSALTASAVPLAPPAAWFADPRLDAPTSLKVGTDGRVSGHLALWGTCHTTHTQRGQCISPPHSSSGYSHFHLGYVVTEEGDEIAVGPITLDTKHATLDLTAAGAASHYDNTGSVVADVRVGEDMYGIWVAGALRPGTPPEKVRALRAAPLSGDWRGVGTDSELVAILAVNTPGYPIPRPQGRVRDGRVMALVASGMLPPTKVRRPGTPDALSTDDLRYLRRLAARERKNEADALAQRAHAARDAVRVHSFAARRRNA